MAQEPKAVRPNFVTMKYNFCGSGPNGAAFEVATNICNRFELGAKNGNGHWLQGLIGADGDFVFNGRLFLPAGAAAGTIIDNFPKAVPNGWTRRPLVDAEGYDLASPDGKTVLFAYRVRGLICHVTTNIYASDGDIVAESLADELRIYSGPAIIGSMRFG